MLQAVLKSNAGLSGQAISIVKPDDEQHLTSPHSGDVIVGTSGAGTLEQHEAELLRVYLGICKLFGEAVAVQAVGRLLSNHPPTGSRASAVPAAAPAAAAAAAPAPMPAAAAADSEPDSSSEPASPRTSAAVLSKGGKALGNVLGRLGGSSKWQRALEASHKVVDPWMSRNIHLLPMEHCVRHRYNPRRREWVTDDVLVKMEARPFAAGAMRECLAMKKLSTFTNSVYHDWKRAPNHVAKRYKKEGAAKQLYYTDVLVQMDAKLMGEEYNKTDPPKQVDVMQCCIVEFPDRPGSPLYCTEQLIEGDYVKYNSNSGFVMADDLLRHTPQAFSHFTWEWSKGQRICVDIQGVGDLYTDPQIHTLDGESYGEGNLGMRGMALFFRTHECNGLCARLGLRPFDRCTADVKAQGYASESSTAASGGTISRTLMRPSAAKQAAVVRKQSKHVSQPKSKAELMAMMQEAAACVDSSAESLVHLEVSKLYAETVLLPELRPEEDPADALRGAVFHMLYAASKGCLVALVLLARVHCGLEPSHNAFAHLVREAQSCGEIVAYPEVSFKCTQLAAERGVANAAAALAHAYATAQGVAEGVLEEPQPALAVEWYHKALKGLDELAALEGKSEEGAGAGAEDNGDADGEQAADGEADAADAAPGSPARPDPSSAPSTPGTPLTPANDGLFHGVVTAKLPQPSQYPSNGFRRRQKLTAEDEASGLPGAGLLRYEMQAALAGLLAAGGPGLKRDAAAAAALYNEAAEAASAAMKGKLAQRYFELAARLEGEAEEEGEGEEGQE